MAMRITNRMLTSNFLSNYNVNLQRMQKHQTQLYTGNRINKLSDDPVGIMKSMTSRVKINRLKQYSKNAQTSNTWLTQAETNLLELNSMIQSAHETIVQLNNDTYSEEDRAMAAEYIKQLRDNILDLANGQESERYIYGGYATTTKPFTLDTNGRVLYQEQDMSTMVPGTPHPLEDEVLQFEVGSGIYCDATITGIEFMGKGEDNLYNMFDDLYKVLCDPNKRDEIAGYLTKLKGDGTTSGALSHVLAKTADIGGRLNRLDMLENRYATDIVTYSDVLSEVESVDYAEASMNWMMSRVVYNAALNSGAQLMQMGLLDYMG